MQATSLSTTLTQNSFRFDASDRMPNDVKEAFLQGILDFVSGVKNAQQVCDTIEQVWLDLETTVS